MKAIEAAPLARVESRGADGAARVLRGASQATGDSPTGVDPAIMAALQMDEVARAHLLRHADTLGVDRASLQSVVVESKNALAGGAQLVRFQQKVGGLDVFHARASVLMDSAKNLVSLASNLSRASGSADAKGSAKLGRFALTPETAVARAYTTVAGVALAASAVTTRGAETKGFRDYAVTTPDSAARVLEATSKPVLFPAGNTLVAAYHVELLVRGPLPDRQNAGFGYVIAANDGRVLWNAPLTASESFTYRVWAEPDPLRTPTDGPLVDSTPHPTGKPDGVRPGYAAPVLVATDGFNKNPAGGVDPWLEAGATTTVGNNVEAYSDRNQSVGDAGVDVDDGFDDGVDLHADTTAANTFDRVYDVTRAPNADDDQIKAAVTQIFYVTNWLHDYFYDSGFDEAAGNAQKSNYGRGGEEGDPLYAEAQDSAESGAGNNANMSTLGDGKSPRMQMYVWSGLPNRSFATEPAVELVDGLGAATYGPQTFDIGASKFPLELVDDDSVEVPPDGTGEGTTSDGCQELADLEGAIAVVDRGQCPFVLKVENAQAAGASAVIILDNTPGHEPPSPASAEAEVDIPVLTLSYEDGVTLKAALAAVGGDVPITATTFARGAETEFDGTIDNTVVAHEWGHYLHHRLVLCGQSQCGGMSEGFGDFLALLLTVREGDTFAGKAYPMAQYATGSFRDAAYFGTRRAPYSTDLAINPFTFTHVRSLAALPETAPLASTAADMSESHNVGEIWAALLFEGYANLIEAGNAAGRPFGESKRRMADYLVAGLLNTPIEPSFVEQRDAILNAVWAMAQGDPSRAEDFTALTRGFAKRGLGVGAVAPPTVSETLDEAVENFSTQGALNVAEVAIDDTTRSCDSDGKLDSGEAGQLTLELSNTGWASLVNSRVKVTSSDAELTFDNGGVAQVAALAPYEKVALSFGVQVERGSYRRGLLNVTVNALNEEAVVVSTDVPLELRYNYDDVKEVSASDDVESDQSPWVVTSSGDLPVIWAREGDARNHTWHGDDFGAPIDQSLVSPDLVVREDVPFIINFSQRYSFELNAGPDGTELVPYDGGVLEVSEDGGATWRDISVYGDPGYTGTLFTVTSLPVEEGEDPPDPDTNALAGRDAFAGESAGYPAYARASIDLGYNLAGQTIKLRFRIGTDTNTGAEGWDIDDISFGSAVFGGITNTPFSSLQPNAQACR